MAFCRVSPDYQEIEAETKELRPKIRDMIGKEGWQRFWRFFTVKNVTARLNREQGMQRSTVMLLGPVRLGTRINVWCRALAPWKWWFICF